MTGAGPRDRARPLDWGIVRRLYGYTRRYARIRNTLSAIEAARHGRTTLLVTSRFSALRAADEIFVLDAGRIVERGPHAALAGAGGLYARAAAVHGLGDDG